MKHTITGIAIGAGIVGILALIFSVAAYKIATAPVQPETVPQERPLGSAFALEMRDTNGDSEATTTGRIFLALNATASTTLLNANTQYAESIDLNILAEASSTTAVIAWEEQFSHNNIDFYCEDGQSVVSTVSVTHGSGCVIHRWTPGTVSTTSKNFTITPTASKYIRLNFRAQTASSTLYAQLILKKPLAQ